MWLPQVGERRQIIRMWANHVRSHLTSRDKIEDDINDIISELATIEEALWG